MKRSPSGEYEILGISYSQYAKADLDYAYTLNLNEKNALASTSEAVLYTLMETPTWFRLKNDTIREAPTVYAAGR